MPKSVWNSKIFNVRHELSVAQDYYVLLRGCRIIIPYVLRHKAIQLVHEGHQGVVKTRSLVRSKIWYPGIDRDIEKLVSSCIQCQANIVENKPSPLHMSPTPVRPWSVLNIDFCGPFPKGEYLLVSVDQFSRFPILEILKSLSTSAVVVALEHVFSQYGIPHVLISDNGPPFSGQLFASYLAQQGIQHRRVTPYWPQAIGEAERFMRTIQKVIRAACSEGKDWKREINNLLLNYRATLHATTQHAPGHVMFGRDIRTKVPELSNSLPVQHKFEKLHVKDTTAKLKMKQHADLTRKAVQRTVKVGDRVLLKAPKVNKLSTP